MDVLSSTFRLKSFLNVTGLLNATSSEIEGPIFFLHSDDNFRCVPRPWDFFHPPVTSYSSGCSGTPRVGDVRGWSVLGGVLLMGSGGPCLVSPHGSLDRLKAYTLFPLH